MSASGDTLKTESSSIKRWSITASVGYGFPFSKQVIGGVGTVDGNSNIKSKLVIGTFGKGVFSFVAVGYKINEHFGSEFGIHSTWGTEMVTSKVTDLSTGYVFLEKSIQVSTNGMFAGFFMTDTYSKFHISLHNDLLIGILNTATEETFSNGVKPTWKYSGRISYGWLSRIGGSYDISEKINIGLIGFFLMHSWSPAKGETLNGQNTIVFTDTPSSNGFYTLPGNQYARVTYPLHAAGVNVFIGYVF